ncbi:MAG: hypothetical protein Q4G39_05210 [Brachymonas sp.]|nr:hypothetical protein [Brachymonas sp.]
MQRYNRRFDGMGFPGFFNHLLNFVLPAFWMATSLLLIHWLLRKRGAPPLLWGRHWLCLFASGVAVLVAGLVVFQRDGRMATYVALAVVMGLVQAWLARRKAGLSAASANPRQ